MAHFPKHTELRHFTLLFCRGRLRNVQRFLTQVRSCCSAHYTLLVINIQLQNRLEHLLFPNFCHDELSVRNVTKKENGEMFYMSKETIKSYRV